MMHTDLHRGLGEAKLSAHPSTLTEVMKSFLLLLLIDVVETESKTVNLKVDTVCDSKH